MIPHRIHAFGVGVLVMAAAGFLVLILPSRRLATEHRLPIAERLPEATRAALSTQMRTHARGMLELTSMVTMLDYDAVGPAVQRLLDEPRVARPLSKEATELNGQLPARFFSLQDELRDDLEELARAAATHDANALANAYATTTKACIRCHDTYLTGR
jgi:cytochrome c556